MPDELPGVLPLMLRRLQAESDRAITWYPMDETRLRKDAVGASICSMLGQAYQKDGLARAELRRIVWRPPAVRQQIDDLLRGMIVDAREDVGEVVVTERPC